MDLKINEFFTHHYTKPIRFNLSMPNLLGLFIDPLGHSTKPLAMHSNQLFSPSNFYS